MTAAVVVWLVGWIMALMVLTGLRLSYSSVFSEWQWTKLACLAGAWPVVVVCNSIPRGNPDE